MTANELRIGNLIQDTRHPERECVVHRLTAGIDFSITYRYDKSKELSYSKENNDALKGIPLTDDWLKMARFVHHHLIDLWFNPKSPSWNVYNREGRWFVTTEYRDNPDVCEAIYVDHVHTLQNFFALTGEELQFTDKTQQP